MISKFTYGFILTSIVASAAIVSYRAPTDLNILHAEHAIAHIVRRPTGGLRKFLVHMGKMEGGSYTTVGGASHKYLGLYQFHPNTIASLGVKTDADNFLHNPALQDSTMILYMKDNARDLQSIIKTFAGTTYQGVYITKSGILAGAHLVGSVGVMAYFYPEKYSYRTTDGNGVHVSHYIKQFANYELRGL